MRKKNLSLTTILNCLLFTLLVSANFDAQAQTFPQQQFVGAEITSTTNKNLFDPCLATNGSCGRTAINPRIIIKVDVGENYDFGSSGWLANINVEVNGYTVCSAISGHTGGVGKYITIDNRYPEKVWVLDVNTHLAGSKSFNVLVNGSASHPEVAAAMRVTATLEYDLAIKPTAPPTLPSAPAISGVNSRMAFNWTAPCPEVNNYQFQLLRLFNQDETNTVETTIDANIDWDKALNIETQSAHDTIILTMAEERGYYIWRVRAVGNVEKGGANHPDNLGPWSNHGSLNSGTHHFTGPQGNYLFFYQGFDETKNWNYSRSFREGDSRNNLSARIAENITYANGLKQAKQQQERNSSNNLVQAGQTIYDYTGRPALKGMSVPLDNKSGFGYEDNLMQHSGTLYGPQHFDEDNNFKLPKKVDASSPSDPFYYYSDNNTSEPDIPNAEGYPYSRTLFYEDATGRVLEQGGIGYNHRIDTTQLSKTNKTFYNTVAKDELIRVFGDEAPKAASVYKKISINENQVAKLEYVDEEGRVIASALTINGRNLYSADEDSMRGSLRGTPTELDARFDVIDTLNFSMLPAYTKLSSKQITIVEREGKWVGLNYDLRPSEVADFCSNFCKSCDYFLEMTIFAFDDTVRVPFMHKEFLLPPGLCASGQVFDWDTLLHLPKGRYNISKKIRSHNTNPATAFPQKLYIDEHVEALEVEYQNLYNTQVLPYINLINAGKLNGLYHALGIDTTADPTTMEALDGTTRKILYGCDSLEIPIRVCVPYSCPGEGIEFYERFLDFNDPPTADGSGRLDIFENQYSAVEFNQLVTNMIADGYNCDSLWGCWENLAQNYHIIQDAYQGTGSGRVNLATLFLECTGYRINGGTSNINSKYGNSGGMLAPNVNPNPGYLSHAYAYIYYDPVGPNASPPCESLYGGSPFSLGFDAVGNPWNDSIWYGFMKCVQSFPYASTLPPTDYEDLATEMTDSCEIQCDLRRFSFITAIIDAFHQDSIYVEKDKYYLGWDNDANKYRPDNYLPLPALFDFQVCWSEVECLADLLVNRCKQDCQISVQYDGMGQATGIGSATEIKNFQNALAANFSIDFPVNGNCPLGFEHLSFTTCAHHQPIGVTPAPQANLISALNSILMGGSAANILPNSMPNNLVYQVGGNCLPLPSNVGIKIDNNGFEFALFDGSGNYLGPFNGCTYSVTNFLTAGASFAYNSVTHSIEIHLPAGVVIPIDCIEWCNLSCEEIYTQVVQEMNAIFASGATSMIDLSAIGGGGFGVMVGGECHSAQAFGGWGLGLIVSNGVIQLVQYEVNNPNNYTVLCSETLSNWDPENTVIVYNAAQQRLVSYNNLTSTSVLLSCFEVCCENEASPSSGGGINGNCDAYKEICFKWDSLSATPFDTVPFAFVPLTCEEIVLNYIANQLDHQVWEYQQEKMDSLRLTYANNCSDPLQIDDYFWLSYPEGIHHYTLFYYDRAGNLIKTVPPKGTDLLDLTITGVRSRQVAPQHELVTDYQYNSIKQLTRRNTPDGGESRFYYNSKGWLRFSQNAQQLIDNTFSYTKFDALGRAVEAGESTLQSGDQLDDLVLLDNSTFPAANNHEIIVTVYNEPVAGLTYLNNGIEPQRFLQNRISYAYSDEDGNSNTTNDQFLTYYSYDVHGNVEWMAQELPYFGRKYIGYTYDLLSGNVLQLDYQKGYTDQFFHRYEYDADNRIINLQTSVDGIIWERDANYSYWDHGPLKRAEIGEDKVQGLDHVYTLQGWLKGINHPTLDKNIDPGKDGKAAVASEVGRDAFGMILNYHDNDFNRSTSHFGNAQANALAAGANRNLYNGNISSWVNNSYNHASHFNPTPSSIGLSGNMTARKYKYDVLDRLLWSEFKDYNSSWVDKNHYNSRYEYDPNGNFDYLVRNSYLDLEHVDYMMDSIRYSYQNNSNRLDQIQDYASSHLLDIFGIHAFTYEAIGNLTSETGSEGLNDVKWTAQGKIDKVRPIDNFKEIKFSYDATGNRVMKRTIPRSSGVNTGEANWDVNYYIRDIQGKILAIYSKEDSLYSANTEVYRKYILKEQNIYGSSRLGQRKGNGLVTNTTEFLINTYPDPNASIEGSYNITAISSLPLNLVANHTDVYSREIGLKHYEVTDHLGNLRVLVSDLKESSWGSGIAPTLFEPTILAMTDYYPFGMIMQGRNFIGSGDYRYGYGGQEKDNEFKGNGNHITFGDMGYDPRIGRRWNVDPVIQNDISGYATFNNNPNFYTDPDGNSPISVLAKQIAKQGVKAGIKKYATHQIKKRLQRYMSKNMKKQFMKDLDDVLEVMDSEWWEVGLELIPVAGDIYGATKFGIKTAKAWDKLQKLENKYVQKVYESLPASQKKKFKKAMRNAGVRDAKKDQKFGIENGEKHIGDGTVEGHHKIMVKDDPSRMSDPSNIEFMKKDKHRDLHKRLRNKLDKVNMKSVELDEIIITPKKN